MMTHIRQTTAQTLRSHLVVLDGFQRHVFEDVGRLIYVQHQRTVSHVAQVLHRVQTVIRVVSSRVIH